MGSRGTADDASSFDPYAVLAVDERASGREVRPAVSPQGIYGALSRGEGGGGFTVPRALPFFLLLFVY
jgi:hypothetical protein